MDGKQHRLAPEGLGLSSNCQAMSLPEAASLTKKKIRDMSLVWRE